MNLRWCHTLMLAALISQAISRRLIAHNFYDAPLVRMATISTASFRPVICANGKASPWPICPIPNPWWWPRWI